MISSDYVRVMARYNLWQTASLVGAADGLDQQARDLDRGVFFGSLTATFNHLLWGDRIWLSRFAGTAAPDQKSIPDSVHETLDWAAFKAARDATSGEISEWSKRVTDADLAGDLTWFSGAVDRKLTRPMAICVTHFFNHQTHHRGQLHAMLTSAGATPDDTDLILMPGS